MSKFKTGDRVVLVKNDADSYNKIGDVGIVTKVDVGCSLPYRVEVCKKVKKDETWSFESDLALFEDNFSSKIISVEKKITIKLDGYRKTITEKQALQLIDELIEATQ